MNSVYIMRSDDIRKGQMNYFEVNRGIGGGRLNLILSKRLDNRMEHILVGWLDE